MPHFQGLIARATLPHPNHQAERNHYEGWGRFSDRYDMDPFFVEVTGAIPRCRCGRYGGRAHSPEPGCPGFYGGQAGPSYGDGGYGPNEDRPSGERRPVGGRPGRVQEPWRRPSAQEGPEINAWDNLERAQINRDDPAPAPSSPHPSDPGVGPSTQPQHEPTENRPTLEQLARRYQDPTVRSPTPPGGHTPNIQITFVPFGCGHSRGPYCHMNRQAFTELEMDRCVEEEEHLMVHTAHSEQPLVPPSQPNPVEQAILQVAFAGGSQDDLDNALAAMGLNSGADHEESEDDEEGSTGAGVHLDGDDVAVVTTAAAALGLTDN